ncbi:hypothetical protein ACFO3A_08305 [Comamonas nitrativorans]|uniref:Flagellar hook-length control protein-like C-terminal domain-containing protein n=1 Tax=Comamonas nitrativorans TaxID=108437 RepID=A0ABV9GY72_9BURK
MTSLSVSPVLSSSASAAAATARAQAALVSSAKDTTSATPVTPSTVLEISTPKAKPVYALPTYSGPAWAMAFKDAISTRMAGNSSMGSLVGQWGQLGGMLLSHLSSSNTGYSQTLLSRPDATGDLDMQMRGVRSGAATASLEITTRSGQKVQLQIAVNSGKGLHVEIQSSGPLSATEREALAALSEGLDRALAGLGQEGGPQIDLSGLMDYDRKAFAGLNLSVSVPEGSNTRLQALHLRLDDQRQSLELKTDMGGNIAINLNPATALASADPAHKQAALNQHLQNIHAAAQRSHADADLVALFTSSFAQMHGLPASAAPQALMPAALGAQVAPLLSGLADFEASFSGDFQRTNRWGAVTEQGHTDYQISQRTDSRYRADTGSLALEQTVHTALDGHIAKALLPDGMLDMQNGNYELHTLRDRQTTRTRIAAEDGLLTQAEQTHDAQQLLTVQKFVENHLQEQYQRPHQEQWVKQLLATR